MAQGSLTVQLLSGETLLATSVIDMTALLDGAFVDILFDRPVAMQQGQAYSLAITAAPAAPEDVEGWYTAREHGRPGAAPADAFPRPAGPHSALQYITNYTGTRFALKAFAPLAALVLLAVAGGWWLLFVKRAKSPLELCVPWPRCWGWPLHWSRRRWRGRTNMCTRREPMLWPAS